MSDVEEASEVAIRQPARQPNATGVDMTGNVVQSLTASLVGGVLVALIGFLATRQKMHAEAEKYRAEAEKVRAETAKLMLEVTTPTAPAVSSDREERDKPPIGWFKSGSHPEDYDVGIDRTIFHSGSASAYIRARADPKGFATLMQITDASPYMGMRLQLSVYIRTRGVGGDDGWTAAWMRIDGGDRKDSLAFDNMNQRRIRGTTEWTEYSIVLDVPESSETLNYGVLLAGPGTVWFDDIRFTMVDDSVPVTDLIHPFRMTCPEPTNLDFEEGVWGTSN